MRHAINVPCFSPFDDLPRLADLRATLRQRLEDSPLCDGPAYARNVEDALRAMWDAHAGGGKDRTP